VSSGGFYASELFLQALVLDLETGVLECEVLGFGDVLDSFLLGEIVGEESMK
jgi:hypothetical protein